MVLIGACAAAPAAAAELDPAAAIAAYSEAFNAHDVGAAVALFDQYGSATDIRGRHYDGPEGLFDFVLASGITRLDAQIKTESMHIVGNRAVWRYSCNCASGVTEVRLVVNRDKITVFAITPPPTAPYTRRTSSLMPWMFGAGVAGFGVLGGAFTMWRYRRREPSAAPARRYAEGQLLLALAEAQKQRWDCRRLEFTPRLSRAEVVRRAGADMSPRLPG
jgi:hypothetical protein